MIEKNPTREQIERELSASFNDAIGTLETLREVNKMMNYYSQLTNSVKKQGLLINLIRAYFRNCSFLMSDGGKKFVDRVNNLKISSRLYKGRRIQGYSSKLEREMNELMREIQFEIKKYLMPSSKDPRFTWNPD